MNKPVNKWLVKAFFSLLLANVLLALLPLRGGGSLICHAQVLRPDSERKGVSGVEPPLYDPGRTDYQSGLKPFEWFFSPPPVPYESRDPEERLETEGKPYSPYLLLQVHQNLTIGGKTFLKGYYQLKLGQRWDGAPAVNLKTLAGTYGNDADSEALGNPDNRKQLETTPSVIVLKQLGRVIAVFPIHRAEVKKQTYWPPKRRRSSSWARIAYLSPDHPWLVVETRRMRYKTDLLLLQQPVQPDFARP